MNAMKIWLVLWCAAGIISAFGQDGPKKPPTEASAEFQSKILKIQLQQSALTAQYNDCQQKAKTIPDEFQRNFNAMQLLAMQAIQDAKLDPKEWELDMTTFQFTKKPQPPKQETEKPK
jgi:hypothetical protein